ncbi:MAG: sigma-54 dependent transcriptional regulator [Acidobacteriota bacterium]
MIKGTILVVDDESYLRQIICEYLKEAGYKTAEAGNCQDAINMYQVIQPDVVVCDYSLPDGTALTLLPQLRAIDKNISMIVLTGHGSINLAVQAIKEGAEHFLTKPIELATLCIVIERILENLRNRRKQIISEVQKDRLDKNPFLGVSPAMQLLAEQVRMIINVDTPILIEGETGTGKTRLARWIHDHGHRAKEPFVDLNCAGLSPDLLESELFGHEKGAFTGAITGKPGLFETANHGTVFLDEIGDIDLRVQPKLLKAIEEQRFRRLGGVRDLQVNIRLIAATHENLYQLVESGKFRSDLYFRINTLTLRIPPLRKRPDDIPIIARHLLRDRSTMLGRGEMSLSRDAIESIKTYPWPGNIREMRNILERAVLLSTGKMLTKADLRLDTTALPAGAPVFQGRTIEDVERSHIEETLKLEGGNVDRAAVVLGLSRSGLYKKIKKHGIIMSRNVDIRLQST